MNESDVVEVVDISRELTRVKPDIKTTTSREPDRTPFISYDEPPLAKRRTSSVTAQTPEILPASYTEIDSSEQAPAPRKVGEGEVAPTPRSSGE